MTRWPLSFIEAFRRRSLAGETYPYLWLDATYLKVREGGRVVSMAVLVAVGVARSGERRVLGLELAPGNDEGSAWPAFVRSLVERGLVGVRLVISDDHRGLVSPARGCARPSAVTPSLGTQPFQARRRREREAAPQRGGPDPWRVAQARCVGLSRGVLAEG